jgi:hypothetical protein
MAIHLTPTELAREAGMERREVIEKCMELGCISGRSKTYAMRRDRRPGSFRSTGDECGAGRHNRMVVGRGGGR